ncbi:MAG: hypothetical protein IIA17_00795 [candidate division Zixibacteria bacterium]|nr:hypothetical protein [candidate division Zixibacteria bacterium]
MYFVTKINNTLLSCERRIGRYGTALLVAFLLLILAAIYVRPALETVVLGNAYAELASDPFSENPNVVGFRILTPLISYVLGLRGQLIIVTNLLFAFAFLAAVYLYFRKELSNPTKALFGTSVFAFSLVTLTTIYYGGYCDSATYLIILGMWILRSNSMAFYVLLFLGLLNRESILFLLPWFIFLGVSEADSKVRTVAKMLLGYGLVFVLYYLFRTWVSSFRPVFFDFEYYFGPLLENPLAYFNKSYGHQGLGYFTVFKAMWIFVFAAVFSFWNKRMIRPMIEICLILFFVWTQMFIAWDSSRMLTLAFPVMLISLLHLFKNNPYNFRNWGYLVLFFNLIIPQMYTAAHVIEFMRSIAYISMPLFLTVGNMW